MQTNRIEVSKDGNGKSLYIPLGVFRSSKNTLTVSSQYFGAERLLSSFETA